MSVTDQWPRSTLVLAMLLSLSAPVTARASTASPELPVADTVVGRSPHGGHTPAAAAGSGLSLVVWGRWIPPGYNTIWGARVTPDGAVLDISAFQLSSGPQADLPAVGSDGDVFLVVWQREVEATLGPYSPFEIRAARVTADGEILDPEGVVLGFGRAPAVAGLDGSFLVAWSGYEGVEVVRVTVASLTDRSSVVLIAPGGTGPTVGAGSTGYLVAWQTDRTILATPVSGDGTPQYPAGRVVVDTSLDGGPPVGLFVGPETAWNGTSFLVAWEQDPLLAGWREIGGVRIHPSEWALDEEPISIGQAKQPEDMRVASAPGVSLVTWAERGRGADVIVASRVLSNGNTPDHPGFIVNDPPPAPISWGNGLTFLGEHFLSVSAPGGSWQSSAQVLGTRIALDTSVLDDPPLVISNGVGRGWAETAAGPQTSLIVWEDYRPGVNPEVRASRINASGSAVDGDGIRISQEWGVWPRLASAGDLFLVAWKGPEGIYAARVASNGAVLDPGAIRIAAEDPFYLDAPSVASDGTGFLV
ncbi:MAG: hypothetical protein HY814_13895, partial [Candidatus Riflebacteria bacterium]|nr:hypothetical protein [Candidatus Riflebacteria bacterium]